jgi:hypothetical protein
MGAEYFLDINGQTEGPFSFEKVAGMWRDKLIRAETMYAVDGGAAWKPVASLFGPTMVPPISAPPLVGPSKALAKRRDWFCTSCHIVCRPKKLTQGSFLMEICLWCLFFIPGFIYTLWRLTSKRLVCPACHSTAIIQACSPAASQFVQIV